MKNRKIYTLLISMKNVRAIAFTAEAWIRKKIDYDENKDTATRVQILDETGFISHSTNTLGKGMNPIILPPAMGK